ncbi:GNAT family N-acetyltransferase [Chitinivibrio alkaliphilus]|uniref:N-Acyltransferase superfamily protein n=1 Tax=Chitinivibrio alkaliphilus ACht1 TaxID=1313304 RepID=U7D6L1_9BACT|nr:GNAT family N-acetyltransferase [Chitinivibrio alkaliphilus]ERP30722.1 N-Acyltransferase superfamily protein [Chitinivibrio alkaliphilus ACht1]
MTQSHAIYVRPLVPAEDAAAVAALAKRAFPPTESVFVGIDDAGGYIAEAGEQVAGVCLIRVVSLPGKKRVGYVSWLMSDPAFRGQGGAQRLVDTATMQSEFFRTGERLG